MGQGLRLELRQSQQLVMTPQLQQAIKLLQMSNFELGAYVAEEIERNPLLREATDTETSSSPRENASSAEAAETTDSRVTSDGDLSLIGETFDAGTDNVFDPDRSGRTEAPAPIGERATARLTAARPLEDGGEGFESRMTRPVSLREHLASQIGQAKAPVAATAAALALVDELDESGYLQAQDPCHVMTRLGVPRATVDAGLRLLQSCDPTGVGARSLAECLALQLAERDRLDPAMQALIDNLQLLGRGQTDRLRQICGVDGEDLADMIAEIRALNPRPCADFAAEDPETVVPDVFVRANAWGGWTVELNADSLPQVLLDTTYSEELARGGAPARAFLATCRENASWLIKSLDQRARTILKVSSAIVRHQEAFFEKGVAGLRPLSLKMVAEEIGMHESTVSRVTSNKYLSTNRGIFELKFFFSNAVGGGDGTSAEAVRSRVRALIQAERPDAVLSDDDVVDALRAEGVDIARRTVAKYRSSLGIPSSVQRRRAHALGAVR